MNTNKVLDAYYYLEIKSQYRFEEKVLKMLWFADVLSLRKYGRSVSGCDLGGGIKELPVRDVEFVRGTYRDFGNLSRSDMMIMDFVFLYFEGMTEKECDDFEIPNSISLEGILEGLPYAKELMEDIKENIALKAYFRKVGI